MASKSSGSLHALEGAFSPIRSAARLPHPPHMRSALFEGSPIHGRTALRTRTAMLATQASEASRQVDSKPDRTVRSRTAMLLRDESGKAVGRGTSPDPQSEVDKTNMDAPIQNSPSVVTAIAKNLSLLVGATRSSSRVSA